MTTAPATIEIYASSCCGIMIQSTTTSAALVRINSRSIRVRRLSSTSRYGSQITSQLQYGDNQPEETFRFCRVLQSGEHLYRGGHNETIRLTPPTC